MAIHPPGREAFPLCGARRMIIPSVELWLENDAFEYIAFDLF
jgi:hypothetical protein